MKKPNFIIDNERKGELYMFANALLESWFPIIILFTYVYITPIFTYALNIFIATFLFIFLILSRKKLKELQNKEAYKYLLLTTLFITLLFLFVFLGLQYTTATNTAVILFLQLFFSFLYFNVLGKEYISLKHLVGAFLMGSGAIAILFPENFYFNKGDLFVLIAAMIAPIANYYQKKSRHYVSVETILAFRYIVSFPFIILLGYFLEPLPTLENFLNALPFLCISGLMIFGLAKIFWVDGVYHISITKASALASLVPFFTMILAYFFLQETPTPLQIFAIIPIVFGGFLIMQKHQTN